MSSLCSWAQAPSQSNRSVTYQIDPFDSSVSLSTSSSSLALAFPLQKGILRLYPTSALGSTTHGQLDLRFSTDRIFPLHSQTLPSTPIDATEQQPPKIRELFAANSSSFHALFNPKPHTDMHFTFERFIFSAPGKIQTVQGFMTLLGVQKPISFVNINPTECLDRLPPSSTFTPSKPLTFTERSSQPIQAPVPANNKPSGIF